MPELARPGDPLIHGIGRTFDPIRTEDDTPNIQMEEKRSVLPRFEKFVPVKERTVEDMPERDTKEQMAMIALIGARLLGLDMYAIADMFGVDIDTVTSLVTKPATQATFERMFVALINHNADNIQGRIASYANKAVTTVVDLMEDTETRSDVRLKAAQDILDRSGANAEQFFAAGQDSGAHDDELKIVVMDESGESEKVRVEIKRK